MMSPVAEVQPVVASASVLHAIAHELRQPLSTIESIAYYLALVLPREDEKIQEQISRLQKLVEQSNWILTSGLQLTDLSPGAPEPTDLEELITQTVSSRPAGIDQPLRLELAGDLPLVRLDPGLARALIENLLMLFRQLATDDHPVVLRSSRCTGHGVLLEMETAATGYRSENALVPGAALSLEGARRIVEAHGGSLESHVDAASGIRLCVVLP
jgi:signal transduction histidine kinase